MNATPVIAILDIGKTNKKIFLFDEDYKIVWEKTDILEETIDEEGDACEDVEKLTRWVIAAFSELEKAGDYSIRAINFTAYGASLVHIGAEGKPVAPLYNYLKAYPSGLKKKFYDTYGGEVGFSKLTASPVLGNLNSGMQLYRIKVQQPELFNRIKYSLHLPQYISFLVTGKACSEMTSIGCHTNLWNFSRYLYHVWVLREGVFDKLAPIYNADMVLRAKAPWRDCVAGIGLHDSSAAMIPYLENFREPFVLISTGTWCISMNPFNQSPLTVAELQKDCLRYISYQGKPVKASRIFAGYEHEQQVKKLAAHFNKPHDYYTSVSFDSALVLSLRSSGQATPQKVTDTPVSSSVFGERQLTDFSSYEAAYHRLLMDIMDQQIASTRLVLQGKDTQRIFVDGGFGKNPVYMHLLAMAFPHIKVFAASISQATAIGAALAIHSHWNTKPQPLDIIELKYFSYTQ